MDSTPFRCRSCGHEQVPRNAMVRARLEEGGLCQGCRAARTLSERPWLLPDLVAGWQRTGFPRSNSWLEALDGPADTEARPSASPADADASRPEPPDLTH